jgi:hypothetical protein
VVTVSVEIPDPSHTPGCFRRLVRCPGFFISMKGSESMSTRKEELMKQMQAQALTEVELPRAWGLSDKGLEAIKIASAMNQTKHGLYASIPMLCKAEKCPYAAVCPLVQMGKAPEGERCPMEIAMILKKYEEYSDEFGIDERNVVDMGLVKDLIDYDIQVFRAENKIAVQGDFVEDVVITVTEGGEAITAPQLSKATEYKDKIMTKRFKILELMNSTRKDKAGDKLTLSLDPSSYAAQLMSQIAPNMKPGQIIDADYDDVEGDE